MWLAPSPQLGFPWPLGSELIKIRALASHSASGVLIERCPRLVMLIKLADATVTSTLPGFTAKLRSGGVPRLGQGVDAPLYTVTGNTGVMLFLCYRTSP